MKEQEVSSVRLKSSLWNSYNRYKDFVYSSQSNVVLVNPSYLSIPELQQIVHACT